MILCVINITSLRNILNWKTPPFQRWWISLTTQKNLNRTARLTTTSNWRNAEPSSNYVVQLGYQLLTYDTCVHCKKNDEKWSRISVIATGDRPLLLSVENSMLGFRAFGNCLFSVSILTCFPTEAVINESLQNQAWKEAIICFVTAELQ